MSTPESERPKAVFLSDLPRGQDCDFFCYVAARDTLMTRSGRPYLRITIRDASRAITFPVWNDAPWWNISESHLRVGAFCKMRAAYFESNHGPQLEIRRIRPATEADKPEGFDPDNLLPPARGDSVAFFNAVRNFAVSELSNVALSKTVCHLLDGSREGWLNQAGGRWHHAQRGGLIEHTYFALQNAVALWENYALAYPEMGAFASRDLVIAGIIVHDVGRVEELKIDATGATTTTLGELIGHSVLGRDKLRDAAHSDLEPELLMRLEHILLSHHSRADFGSPMPPMTLEALIVHLADDTDARIVAALEVMQAEPNSDWTTKRNPTGQKWFRGSASSTEKPE